ncbi:MAG: DUF1761 family protein [Hyphomicrobiales bacterium]|nr:MAG: DUF1761 family protein [Hyphomicrobiales bacterium]
MLPINWLAVLVAAIIRMAVGFAWYSPPLLLKPWQALRGDAGDDEGGARQGHGGRCHRLAGHVVRARQYHRRRQHQRLAQRRTGRLLGLARLPGDAAGVAMGL